MYLLPVFVKKYKTKSKADCFVKNIRLNTLYIYDKDGLLKTENPRGLICRNEKEKIIILKNKPYYMRYSGGTTALMIAENKESDEIIITTIAYHDWGGILWFLFLIALGIHYSFLLLFY